MSIKVPPAVLHHPVASRPSALQEPASTLDGLDDPASELSSILANSERSLDASEPEKERLEFIGELAVSRPSTSMEKMMAETHPPKYLGEGIRKNRASSNLAALAVSAQEQTPPFFHSKDHESGPLPFDRARNKISGSAVAPSFTDPMARRLKSLPCSEGMPGSDEDPTPATPVRQRRNGSKFHAPSLPRSELETSSGPRSRFAAGVPRFKLFTSMDGIGEEEEPVIDLRPKKITIEDIKAKVHLPYVPPLADVLGKPKWGSLLEKMCILQSAYLEEKHPTRSFYQREGAFGYQEVLESVECTLKNYTANIESRSREQLEADQEEYLENVEIYREKTLPPEMRKFFETNLGLLRSEGKLLEEKLSPQIGIFREILADFAQIQQNTKYGAKTDPALIQPLLLRLRKLELELKKTSKTIEENKLAFQPLAQICRRIELNDIKGLTLLAFDGKSLFNIPSKVEPSAELLEECKLAAKLYDSYAQAILDPHFFYCSKFLTAINKFRLELSSSHGASPTLRTAPTILLAPRAAAGPSVLEGTTAAQPSLSSVVNGSHLTPADWKRV